MILVGPAGGYVGDMTRVNLNQLGLFRVFD